MRSNSGARYGVGSGEVPWYLLCLLTLVILFIWKLPYLSATYAHAYNYMVEDFTQRQARLQAILDQQRRQMGTMQ